MRIKINDVPVEVFGDDDGVRVSGPDGKTHLAVNLSALLEDLRWAYGEVSLDDGLFTDQEHVLDQFLKRGFKYLARTKVVINGNPAIVSPETYAEAKHPIQKPSEALPVFRMYKAVVRRNPPAEDGRPNEWVELLNEKELEEHIFRHR